MHTARNFRVLLIEPVWNRNLDAILALGELLDLLLIEPVWNRNAYHPRAEGIRREQTFNRTSMESKQFPETCQDRKGAFNRTSMESKRASR